MNELDPVKTVANIASIIPKDFHSSLTLVGSLAVAYHYSRMLPGPVKTKDADLIFSVAQDGTALCRRMTESLFELGWTRRTEGGWTPQPKAVPYDKLPAIRLYPPKPLGFFIEFLGLPKKDQRKKKIWKPVKIRTKEAETTGWYALPCFRFMGLSTYTLHPLHQSLTYADPSMLALSNLLSHPEIGTETMSADYKGRKVLRSAKDLGRSITIARFSGRKIVETWPEAWAKALRDRFPKTHKAIALTAGNGLRALLKNAAAMEQAFFISTTQGLLAESDIQLAGFQGEAERLLVFALEPLEERFRK